MSFELSGFAKSHLEEIFEYSEINYVLEKTDVYVSSLKAGFDLLTKQPEMGIRLDRKGYQHLRRLRWDSHVIIYDSTRKPMLVVAILHKSADLYRHINKRIFE